MLVRRVHVPDKAVAACPVQETGDAVDAAVFQPAVDVRLGEGGQSQILPLDPDEQRDDDADLAAGVVGAERRETAAGSAVAGAAQYRPERVAAYHRPVLGRHRREEPVQPPR